MKDRRFLQKNQTIFLCERNNAPFRRRFTIAKMINDKGASIVCYEAYHENSGKGVLKEFYPRDAYGLERDRSGQLIHSPEFRDAYGRFLNAEQKYIEPYEMLLEEKQHGDNPELATFIPAFEIYHGCNEDGTIVGTTYIWTPEQKLETFDKVCHEIHKHPNHDPEHKLVTVLTAIESLTKCICALHSADMIHRDIKPSNFGFVKRGNETLTQTLSMFDINSICSVYGKADSAMWTEGYMEPEAKYEAPTNQTDIYSIGATLFYAIAVSEEIRAGGYLYQPEYYDRLHEIIDSSRLIQASEANAHPRLRNILTTILRKCLCKRPYRYANCEELLDDLELALYYALPSDIARKSRSGEKWILADVEKSLDANKEKNSLLAIQYHLYQHPLYQCLSKDDESINVHIIGFGNYGQKFLDTCLQVGQIFDKKLNVTVVSGDATDKKIYLSERPELADFFNVDGLLAGHDDTYGDITFETTKLERRGQAANADILRNLMYEQRDTKCPHYVFIALGEDSLNFAAAKACRTAVKGLKRSCIISYVCEGRQAPSGGAGNLRPVYVNSDIKTSELYAEIERMAFNTHLVWEKNLNVDYTLIRADFRKPYNHDSCVSNVLALKYKLHSMGIDLETAGFNEAARLFCEMLSDKSYCEVKHKLIWIEHRRWVTEKLCLGWRRIQNLEDCAGGVTKDEKRKRHICILRSRPDQKLATEYRTNENYDRWDTASDSDLSQLDELDRMSVELHRVYAKKAVEARTQNLLSGNSITGIRTLIEGNKKAIVAFQEWFTCLKDIWNGDIGKVRLCKGLRNAFLNAAETLPDDRKKSVREQVKAFETMFYPVLASTEYRDWKQDDAAFIDSIPFVLTYTEDAYMAIPYAAGDRAGLSFENVAAPTVASPLKILYLYLIEKKQDVQELQKSIPYVIEYMNKKRFKAAVDFVCLYTNTMASMAGETFENELKGLGGGRIRQVKRIRLDGPEDAAPRLGAYLKQRSAGKRLFAVERNRTRLSSLLQGAGFYNSFSSYQFDSGNMKFQSLSGCDMLGYIRKTPYITVTDMAAFRLSSSESSNQPEFFDDHEELWRRYYERSGIWKLLCNILGDYAEKNDVLASFKKRSFRDKSTNPQEYRYILPFTCSGSAAKILQFLSEQDIIETGSRVNGYTANSCEVVIVDRCGYRTEYDKLFSHVYALMLSDAITLHLNTKRHEVNVVFDDLVVSGVQFAGNRIPELSDLMNYFKEKGYVINLNITPDGRMGFTYATRQIKELLTNAGKMLEVYTYHKVKELGYFDDVVSSFEIDWEGTGAKSEFDCILTKGFRTLFVECKARSDIEQEFYFRLASLAKKFGINATAVLVADTQEKSFYDNAPINAMQRKRGSMMDVVTVWKSDEINDIGHTLLRIINGNYVGEEE